ncbi:MAG: efflux RND transporter periplasmic adaptor subunit, partial [Cytophagales bacterium]|nr:efflux RND transporter periplasmic adaptor subunit [Cytophagales bacterium]
QLKGMKITLGELKEQSIKPVVYATGKVILLPNSEAIVSSNIPGKVENILVVEGEDVKKGQPLLVVSSMALIELQQNYLAAKNEASFLKLEFERQSELRKNDIGALSEFQVVESKYLTAKNLEESIGEKLKLLGIQLEQLNNRELSNVVNRLYVTSPIEGAVYKLPAVKGMTIEHNTELVEVLNLTRLRADIDLYEKDIDLVKEGQAVEIEFLNQSIPKVTGYIAQIIESIDPESRSVPVYVNFTPPSGTQVFPEMAIKVKITGTKGKETKPTVPMSALLLEGELYYIYYAIKKGEQYEFHKLKVTPGENDDVYTQISFTEQIPKDALIVYENVYLIDAESKKKGSL